MKSKFTDYVRQVKHYANEMGVPVPVMQDELRNLEKLSKAWKDGVTPYRVAINLGE